MKKKKVDKGLHGFFAELLGEEHHTTPKKHAKKATEHHADGNHAVGKSSTSERHARAGRAGGLAPHTCRGRGCK